jgi:hypothetical protein
MRSEQAERAQGRRAKSADYKLAHPSNAHGVAHAVDMQFLAIEPVHDHRMRPGGATPGGLGAEKTPNVNWGQFAAWASWAAAQTLLLDGAGVVYSTNAVTWGRPTALGNGPLSRDLPHHLAREIATRRNVTSSSSSKTTTQRPRE